MDCLRSHRNPSDPHRRDSGVVAALERGPALRFGVGLGVSAEHPANGG